MRISRHRDPSEHLSATLFHENIDLLRRGWCRGGRRPRCRCSSRAAPSPAAQCTPPLAGSSLTTTRVSDPYLVRSGVFAWLRIRFLNPLSGSGSKAHNYAESTLIVFYLFIRIEKNNNNWTNIINMTIIEERISGFVVVVWCKYILYDVYYYIFFWLFSRLLQGFH